MVLDLGKDRNVRRGSGKRSTTKTDLKQGRYVRAEMPKIKVEDLAFDATIRAAAPFQRLREDNGCALILRVKIYGKKYAKNVLAIHFYLQLMPVGQWELVNGCGP